eukprot:Skav234946  [mRNA]  locus=scaffold2817:45862:55642:- [translate_table: standard]
MMAPTAEAWKNIGLCRYRRVKFEPTTARKEKKLKEAMTYFQEANCLDRERPDILSYLSICAVELGLVQSAKQGFRQLMQFEERLATPVALELAETLLRFSDEQRASAWGGERGRLVQEGRYGKEAAMICKVILGRGESGRARSILAWSKFLEKDHSAAVAEFCAALSSLVHPQMTGVVEKAAQDIREATLKHQELVDKTCHLAEPSLSWTEGLSENSQRLEQLFAPQRQQLHSELQQLRHSAVELGAQQRAAAELELAAA